MVPGSQDGAGPHAAGPGRCGRWRSQTLGSGGRTRPGLCTIAPSVRAGRLFRGLGLRVGVACALPWLFLYRGRGRLFLKTLLVHPACRRDFSQGPSLSMAPGRARGFQALVVRVSPPRPSSDGRREPVMQREKPRFQGLLRHPLALPGVAVGGKLPSRLEARSGSAWPPWTLLQVPGWGGWF